MIARRLIAAAGPTSAVPASTIGFAADAKAQGAPEGKALFGQALPDAAPRAAIVRYPAATR